MAAAPAFSASRTSSTECAVSFVVAPAMTGRGERSHTVSKRIRFSSCERTGDSPVVPATTRASLPLSARWRARETAPSGSSDPSSVKGVTIAVTIRPKRARGTRGNYQAGGGIGRPPPSARRDRPLRQLEGGVLVLTVGEVLVLDRPEIGEAGTQPAVPGVEQAEFFQVRHDLREEHGLEGLPVGCVEGEREDVAGRDAHPVPHLLLQEAVAHSHGRLVGELLSLADL